jgi:hypothetical protein
MIWPRYRWFHLRQKNNNSMFPCLWTKETYRPVWKTGSLHTALTALCFAVPGEKPRSLSRRTENLPVFSTVFTEHFDSSFSYRSMLLSIISFSDLVHITRIWKLKMRQTCLIRRRDPKLSFMSEFHSWEPWYSVETWSFMWATPKELSSDKATELILIMKSHIKL